MHVCVYISSDLLVHFHGKPISILGVVHWLLFSFAILVYGIVAFEFKAAAMPFQHEVASLAMRSRLQKSGLDLEHQAMHQ